MSAQRPTSPEDRLLMFEVGGGLYALPISGVKEVAESDRVTAVPKLAPDRAGVMNWHGDALTVLHPMLLTDEIGDLADLPDLRERKAGPVLVVTDREDAGRCLGMPVDRVLGLVEGSPLMGQGAERVVERRPIDGRVMTVMDPRCLVEWAAQMIERMVA